MWYIYFLELNNGDIYVGSTDDLRRRFASHQRANFASTPAKRGIVAKFVGEFLGERKMALGASDYRSFCEAARDALTARQGTSGSAVPPCRNVVRLTKFRATACVAAVPPDVTLGHRENRRGALPLGGTRHCGADD